jgi:hypothetical protein
MRRLLTKLRAHLPRPPPASVARDACAVLGGACVARGAAEIYHPLGWIITGLFALVIAWLSARSAA